MQVRRPVLMSIAVVAVHGCAPPLLNPPSAEVPVDPEQVVRAAEMVFHRHEIPVERELSGPGTLRSGDFEVEGYWGGEPIEARVDCGWDREGLPRAIQGPIRMDVRLRARSQLVDRTRDARPGSRLELHGRGTLLTLGEEVRCTLTREFGERLVDAIAGMTGGSRDRHRPVGSDPGGHGGVHAFAPGIGVPGRGMDQRHAIRPSPVYGRPDPSTGFRGDRIPPVCLDPPRP
jgi:hypothetical protein